MSTVARAVTIKIKSKTCGAHSLVRRAFFLSLGQCFFRRDSFVLLIAVVEV